MMNNHLLAAIIFTSTLMSLSVLAQDDIKAAVDIGIQQDQETWAGQQVTVNLDLKTTGFSFSNSRFNLPKVDGAFLMQTDTTTIKLSETVDGESWQIVRYPIALYPYSAGQLEIPPIDVRFTTSAGYGTTETEFEFQTTPLELMVSMPPGVKEGDLVVTTSSFQISYDWQPETETAHPGDAFTLTVTRRANDISAMLLPPLPVFRTEGLAAYPQAPEVSDKTDRGDLTGNRKDAIIWVVEKTGVYEIPGIRFQWWDPDTSELKQQTIPGLSLEALPSAVDGITPGLIEGVAGNSRDELQIVLFVLAVLLAVVLWWRFGFNSRRQSPVNEQSVFTRLQKACKNNDPRQAYIEMHSWLKYSALPVTNNFHGVTLSEFAEICDDQQLAAELEDMQQALVTAGESWQGDNLLVSLLRIRSKLRKQRNIVSESRLAPLNP